MNIDEFKKLEGEIVNTNYRDSYRNIDKIMFALSIFGHLTSIFLSYFLLTKILGGVIGGSPIIVSIISIVILSSLELLKRDFFNKFSFQFLKTKSISGKDTLPLTIVSLMIIASSFYLSISGAQEFANKSSQIDANHTELVSSTSDSLSTQMNSKILLIENEISQKKSKIDEKDREQTTIESMDRLTTQQRSRIKDLKQEKSDLKNDIKSLQDQISGLKSETGEKIKNISTESKSESDKAKEENSTNAFFFVIISSIIELVILAGVYYNKYYKFRSYSDFKSQIDSDPNFQKWTFYDGVMSIIIPSDGSVGDRIPSTKSLIEICKVNGVKISEKDITDLLKMLSSIGVLKTSGSIRHLQKSKSDAMSTLKTHFNIK